MSETNDDLERHLPLPQSTLNILLALAEEGQTHGYGIKRAIESNTGGKVRIGAGTLYEALGRLRRDGLIYESEKDCEDKLASSRWRYYGISDLGRRLLQAELQRLDQILRYARSRDLMAQESHE